MILGIGFLLTEAITEVAGQYPDGKFTLCFIGFGDESSNTVIELTHNWDESEPYPTGRFFGHLAYEVDNIYDTCRKLMDSGVVINRPPRDGYMAFVKSPDGISFELLQKGERLPPAEPWTSMANTGAW